MKKTKLFAVALAVVLLLVSLTPSVFALDALFQEGGLFSGLSDTIAELLGGNTPGESYALSDLFTNPNGVLDEIRSRLGTELDNSALVEAITQVLGGGTDQKFSLEDLLDNEFLNRLRKYLNMEEVTNTPTSAPTTTPITAPTYTYATQAPTATATAYYYVTTAAPATTATTRAATTATTTPSTLATTTLAPSYTYAQPATVTVPELTTQASFTPSVTDDSAAPQKGSTAKTVVGVMVLILSLGAVVAVAVILRRTAI